MNQETPKLAIDCIVLSPKGIVFIERKYPPLGFALPGGFVDVGETLQHAAKREMREELNVDVEITGQLGIYDEPNRDPRKHVISVVFVATTQQLPFAGDDAKEVKFVKINNMLDIQNFNLNLVFDHRKIMDDFFRSNFCLFL